MHHAGFDWLWWIWQSQDLPARFKQISGLINPYDLTSGNATLKTTLDFGLLAPAVTVADAMDIQGGLMCYEYI